MAKQKATPEELFGEWWDVVAKRAAKIARRQTGRPVLCLEYNDPRILEYTWSEACRAFLAGHLGQTWEPNEQEKIIGPLGDIVKDAYLAGKESVS